MKRRYGFCVDFKTIKGEILENLFINSIAPFLPAGNC